MMKWLQKSIRPSLAVLILASNIGGLGIGNMSQIGFGRPTAADDLGVFDATMKHLTADFHDPSFGGLPWKELVAKARTDLQQAIQSDKSNDSNRSYRSNGGSPALPIIINQLLARLKTSHTRFYTTGDQEYWALSAMFEGPASSRIPQIGAWFQRRGKRWFVRAVYLGSPAAKAGLLRGDEIVAVDNQPFEPVLSFVPETSQKSADTENAISNDIYEVLRRRFPWSEPEVIPIRPETISFAELWRRGTAGSIRVRKVGDRQVGYLRLWAGGLKGTVVEIERAARRFQREADAAILDLRGGFGGANPTELAAFVGHGAKQEPPHFTKPLVVLIDKTTRGGKEWLAWKLKTVRKARLVGTPTAGEFMRAVWRNVFSEKPSPEGKKPLRQYGLYVPVATAKDLGVDLEGKGLQPDMVVPTSLVYGAGHDAALDAAFLKASEN